MAIINIIIKFMIFMELLFSFQLQISIIIIIINFLAFNTVIIMILILNPFAFTFFNNKNLNMIISIMIWAKRIIIMANFKNIIIIILNSSALNFNNMIKYQPLLIII